MPKRKKYQYKSGAVGYTKPRTYGTDQGTQTGVQALKKEIKAIKKTYEIKHHNTTMTSSMIAAGSMQMISNMAVGDLETNREGSKVKMYSMAFGGSLELSNDKGPAVGRIILFIDHDQAGVLPLITDMWTDVGSFTVGHPRNKLTGLSASMRRYTILYDYKFTLSSSGAGVGISFDSADALSTTVFTEGTREHIESYYRRLFHMMNYNGSGVDILAQRQGTMYMFSAVDTDNEVAASAQVMVKYTDN